MSGADHEPPSAWASSYEEIQKLRLIYATLPTGAQMVLRALTLDELAAIEGLPDDLLKVAMLESTPGGVAGEIARVLQKDSDTSLDEAHKLSQSTAELVDRLVLAAVVEPALTAEQVTTLDGFDKAMIAAIASRRIVFDAAGKRVGVEPLETLATFRHEHSCAAACSACERTRLALSAVQPG